MGASVTLITAAGGLTPPYGARVVQAESVNEMLAAVLAHTEQADALIMAAAVSDYTPEQAADQKLKKTGRQLSITLNQTPDILQTVGDRRAETGYPHVLVGFAAETQNLVRSAKSKLERKHADYIIANDVTMPGAGFGVDTNVVTIVGADGSVVSLPQQSKSAVAEAIIQRVAAKLQTVPRRG
jgi:phosphopantothenoylcysteine decarboxylase/phosphopantothenate--cysteine ligase